MRVLLIGATGQIGSRLVPWLTKAAIQFRPKGRPPYIYGPSRSGLDLERPETIIKTVEEYEPDLIVNAGGWTDVAGAEREKARSYAANAKALEVLAELCLKRDCPIIHYSTDYVFDGLKFQPYLETDTCDPVNYYGETKLLGERALLSSKAPCLILRTSWVYDTRGTNFLRKILSQLLVANEIQVVGDQFGTPNSAAWIAEQTYRILMYARCRSLHRLFKYHSGIYHLTASGQSNWYSFALEIVKRMKNKRGVEVKYLSSEQLKGVRRPQYSVLCNQKIAKKFDLHLAEWDTVFGRYVRFSNDLH